MLSTDEVALTYSCCCETGSGETGVTVGAGILIVAARDVPLEYCGHDGQPGLLCFSGLMKTIGTCKPWLVAGAHLYPSTPMSWLM
jgi:hypothetical protein